MQEEKEIEIEKEKENHDIKFEIIIDNKSKY